MLLSSRLHHIPLCNPKPLTLNPKPRSPQTLTEYGSAAIGFTAAITSLVPTWKPAAAPMNGLHKMLLSSRLHHILCCVLFHAAVGTDRVTDGALISAVHILALAADACARDAEGTEWDTLLGLLKMPRPLVAVSPTWMLAEDDYQSAGRSSQVSPKP